MKFSILVCAVALLSACVAPSSSDVARSIEDRSKSIVVGGQEYNALYLSTTRIIYINKASGLSPEENMAQVRAGKQPFGPISVQEARQAALALTRREEGRACTITNFEQSAPTLVRLEFRC